MTFTEESKKLTHVLNAVVYAYVLLHHMIYSIDVSDFFLIWKLKYSIYIITVY